MRKKKLSTKITRIAAAILVISLLLPGCASDRALSPAATLPPASATPNPSPTATITASPTSTEPPASPTPTPSPSRGSTSAGDAYAPMLGNTGYDIRHYNLSLELDPARSYLAGKADIQATSLVQHLVGLSLDFIGFEIDALTVDAQQAAYTRSAEKLIIELPEPLSLGQEFTLSITYQGTPTFTGSPYVPFLGHLGFYFIGQTHFFTLSEPDGARYWFPCNDHPTDKASYTFKITVPAGLTAAANGSLSSVDSTQADQTTFTWDHPYPMATYLAVAAVGEYEVIETSSPAGIPIRHYVFSDLRPLFEQQASITGEVLDWMSAQFGEYPFESFGFVTTRLVSQASETQTRVILPETMINEETIVHEIAHMWFGDWVSLESWGDMWLKEGLAIYSYLMWQTRSDPAVLDAYMSNTTPLILDKSSNYPLGNLPPNLLLSYDSYWKGAAFQHAIRKQIGDETYLSALRSLIQEFGGSSVSRLEFQALLERVSGQSLQALFEEWLDGSA